MNDVIAAVDSREKLRGIIEKNGETILDNSDRLEALLKDHIGTRPREISALLGALAERVPSELKSSWQSAMTPEAMRARLVQRLCEHRGLAGDIATWAVDTWSYALNVQLGGKSERLAIDDKKAGHPNTPQDFFCKNASGRLLESFVKRKETPAADASARPIERKAGYLMNQVVRASQHKRPGTVALAIVAVLIAAVVLNGKKPDPQPSDPSSQTQNNGPRGPVTSTSTGGTSAPRRVVLLVPGTTLSVRLESSLDSDHAQVGDTLRGVVLAPVVIDGKQIIKPGASALLRVKDFESAGHYKGVPSIQLVLEQINIDGRTYSVSSSVFTRNGPSRTTNTAVTAGVAVAGATVAGCTIGKLLHHTGTGCLVGVASGTGITAAKQAKTQPKPATLLAGETLTFRVLQPVTQKA